MNVLLLDDEPLGLEQLELIIKPLCPHWNLYSALDGNQALDLNKQVNFKLAFIDIHLPGRSGLEVAKELRLNSRELDIIIVTAYPDFNYAKESIKLGVVDYLIKPIIENELVELILKYRGNEKVEYSPIVLSALQILHEKYADKLTLPELAHQIHVNSSYLSRRFSEEVKLPFTEYLMNFRIDMAKTLLINNISLGIAQVAESTGFNSQHYFCTLFRKKTGLTPREYREMGK